MIKAQSFEAMLPTKRLFVTIMSLLEQDHQKKAGVQERYEIYENAATLLHTRTLR